MKACYVVLLSISVILLSGCSDAIDASDFITPFEQSDSLETSTYEEGIAWWKALEEASPYVCVQESGTTDAGLPLHLVVVNSSRNFNRAQITQRDKAIFLINNAIHPGEPDGVDASMIYIRDLVSQNDFVEKYEDIVFLIIPFYNVGGALNRNCCSRANQNGPKSYGFRGNARNLDLNRDFIKADSKNAKSFIRIFEQWDPDVYLETHVSNGADYPYTMTCLYSHPGKLSPPQDDAMGSLFAEPLERMMDEQGDQMVPYVNVFGTTPDSGYQRFYDSPRYSTGFAALHHSFGMLTETHMLKPFKQRVASTLRFMHNLGNIVAQNSREIQSKRQEARENDLKRSEYTLDWRIDTSAPSKIKFKGYKAYYDSSTVTHQLQLYYDEDSIWEREIDYFDKLVATVKRTAPRAYLVPLAWDEAIERLKLNGVDMQLITRDTTLDCTVYSIADFETSQTPYEGHYYHHRTSVSGEKRSLRLRANEYYLISTQQKARRYLIEVLEPEGPDSYFNWNFFDEVLQQKEWFSSYVFDQEAVEMLKDPKEQEALKTFIATNPGFRDDAFAQLYFLYRRSAHFERDSYMVYPVFRLE
ncbi:MAG: M14 family zinc carboxypeptidase [Cryomorphaceae bacterium]